MKCCRKKKIAELEDIAIGDIQSETERKNPSGMWTAHQGAVGCHPMHVHWGSLEEGREGSRKHICRHDSL